MCGQQNSVLDTGVSTYQGDYYVQNSLLVRLEKRDYQIQEKFHEAFPSIGSPELKKVPGCPLFVYTRQGMLYDLGNTLFNPLNTRRHAHECHNLFRFTCKPIYQAMQSAFAYRKSYAKYVGRQLVELISMFCIRWELKNCTNPECQDRKQLVLQQLPPCTWTALRDWMATAVSCWQTERCRAESDPAWKAHTIEDLDKTLHASEWDPKTFRFGVSYESLLRCVNLDDVTQGSLISRPCIDVSGVFNLFYWHYLTFDDAMPKNKLLRSWTLYHLLYEPCFLRDAVRLGSSPSVRSVGICPNRFWNLAVEGSEGYVTVLAALLGVSLGNIPPKNDDKHKSCTSQFCNLANDDSTSFEQLHKCDTSQAVLPGADEIAFPLKKLEDKFASPSTAWIRSSWDISSISSRKPTISSDPNSKYMAISHVWSDRTGVGMKEAGIANLCLVEYFKSIACRLGCDGIWWDTICLPADRAARRRALDQMLETFERAAFVVIHDLELVNFEWRDDGTPALALMMSPWFTRGWTAAEFFAARRGHGRVKVLFKSPNVSTQPCIKDLEDDVLAPIAGLYQGRFTNLPHLVASDVIRQLSGDNYDLKNKSGYRVSELSVLLRILRPRTTSWARDRMVLGVLLTLPRDKVNTSRTEPELVSDILRTIRHLPGTAIYHGEIPIAMHGPWSWCPPSVFDMGRTGSVIIPSDAEGVGEGCELMVGDNGSIEGNFTVYRLQDSDLDELLPFGHHPSMEARIRNALLDFAAGCPTLIMQVQGQVWKRHIDLWLLAVPVHAPLLGESADLDSPFAEFGHANRWKCRWIGCVYAGNTRKGESYGGRLVSFGEDVDDKGNPASVVEPPLEAIEEARIVQQKFEKRKQDSMRRDIEAVMASREPLRLW